MELKQFVAEFADLFDDTDASEIQSETKFRDLDEWSSLIAMGVMAMTKTRYGKSINGRDLRGCETVQDIFNLISSK